MRPITSRHFGWLTVLGIVPGVVRFLTRFFFCRLWIASGSSYTLLTEPDCLCLTSAFCDNHMTLGFVIRSPLGLVVCAYPCSCKFGVFFLWHYLPRFFGFAFFLALAAAFLPFAVYGNFFPLTIGI